MLSKEDHNHNQHSETTGSGLITRHGFSSADWATIIWTKTGLGQQDVAISIGTETIRSDIVQLAVAHRIPFFCPPCMLVVSLYWSSLHARLHYDAARFFTGPPQPPDAPIAVEFTSSSLQTRKIRQRSAEASRWISDEFGSEEAVTRYASRFVDADILRNSCEELLLFISMSMQLSTIGPSNYRPTSVESIVTVVFVVVIVSVKGRVEQGWNWRGAFQLSRGHDDAYIMTQTLVVYRPSESRVYRFDTAGNVYKLRSIQVQLNNQERDPQNIVAFIMHQVN
jgi:hypothetical protein